MCRFHKQTIQGYENICGSINQPRFDTTRDKHLELVDISYIFIDVVIYFCIS